MRTCFFLGKEELAKDIEALKPEPPTPSQPLAPEPAPSTQQDTPHQQQQPTGLKHTPQEGSAEEQVKAKNKDDTKHKKDKKEKEDKKAKKDKEKDDLEAKKSKKDKDKHDLEVKKSKKEKKLKSNKDQDKGDLEEKKSKEDQDKHKQVTEGQVKVKKEIGSPVQKPKESKEDQPEVPFDALVAAAGSSGSTGDGQAPLLPSSSSKKSSESVQGACQDGQDITKNFLEEPQGDHKDEASTKDMFISAELIVPGIALKKFKMYLASENHDSADSKFAMLGVGEIRKYRTERKCLQGMVLADMTKMAEETWRTAAKHLENKGLIAIFVASGSEVSLSNATWTKRSLNLNTFTCKSVYGLIRFVWIGLYRVSFDEYSKSARNQQRHQRVYIL